MANAVVTVRVMPESPDVNLKELEDKAHHEIKAFNGGKETKISIQPIAFGLKAIDIIFVMDEKLGSPDVVCEKIAKLEGANSCEVTDCRRALG